MSEIVVRHLSAIEAYSGPNAIAGIRFRAAAAQLGVRAWGMNVLEIDAGCDGHPEHDHRGDGQEEVYVVLRGSARLSTSAGDHELSQGDFARVPAELTRKLLPGPDGVTVLALGGTPDQPYKPPSWA